MKKRIPIKVIEEINFGTVLPKFGTYTDLKIIRKGEVSYMSYIINPFVFIPFTLETIKEVSENLDKIFNNPLDQLESLSIR